MVDRHPPIDGLPTLIPSYQQEAAFMKALMIVQIQSNGEAVPGPGNTLNGIETAASGISPERTAQAIQEESKVTMRIHLQRHGYSEHNAGPTEGVDTSLLDRGYREAHSTTKQCLSAIDCGCLPKPLIALSSVLRRCGQTSEYFFDHLNDMTSGDSDTAVFGDVHFAREFLECQDISPTESRRSFSHLDPTRTFDGRPCLTGSRQDNSTNDPWRGDKWLYETYDQLATRGEEAGKVLARLAGAYYSLNNKHSVDMALVSHGRILGAIYDSWKDVAGDGADTFETGNSKANRWGNAEAKAFELDLLINGTVGEPGFTSQITGVRRVPHKDIKPLTEHLENDDIFDEDWRTAPHKHAGPI